MFSKLLMPVAIFSLIAMVGFLGYTAFVDAEGKGWKCQGAAPSSDWTTDCTNHTSSNECTGNGVLEATSGRQCIETGDQRDYCKNKPVELRNGSGPCRWTGSSCNNPGITDKINVDNC